ncbi:zinc-binding metallopeptidase family protein [Emydomyces testavorans]|uniref:Peptide hydrolase n=1 Tax=Emydomyces testavorans TaxID=2070801 RepID=A0AAF0DJ59_9EURO|nr:zinc-binding metallopeptidase family protein [Emydomyces testavorans]
MATTGRFHRIFLWILWTAVLFSVADTYTALSDESLKGLPRPGTDFDIHNGALLAPILRTRVPGTPGSRAVLEHFVKFFSTTLPDWKIEFQNSTSKTPVTGNKEVPFVNLLAYRDPPKIQPGNVGRLTLVAHYDSKFKPEGFIGATDSAAPCAMILHAIRSIDTALTKRWDAMKDDPAYELGLDDYEGIQVFLLDGEEAFAEWSNTDSLYGSRSLAEHMERTVYPALSTYKNRLGAIKLFVLLDLLGEQNPTVPSYFKTTHWAYQRMAVLESRLRSLDQFRSSKQTQNDGGKKKPEAVKPWFPDASKDLNTIFPPFGIEDDHVPFMKRGVDILHIIPSPFPRTWHRIEDDAAHLHQDTVEDWGTLVTAFIAEWLDLEGYFEKGAKTSRLTGEKRKMEL